MEVGRGEGIGGVEEEEGERGFRRAIISGVNENGMGRRVEEGEELNGRWRKSSIVSGG